MNVGILGLGLIGGSLARAYSMEGHRVLCYDRDQKMLSFSILAGAVESPLTTENLGECDLVLLAIYPEGSAAWLEENGSFIRKDALVMDCCGIKREICSRCFPLAEKYGFTFVDLYSPLYDVAIGEVYEGYTIDGGHFTEKGYQVVTAQITPVLEQLLGR